MWLLSSPGTTLGGTHHWIQPGKEYLVGRLTEKQPCDFYLDQKTISRQHLKIRVELEDTTNVITNREQVNLPRSKLILEDLKSKHHTYVNGVSIEGTFCLPVAETQEFIITLGKSKGINSTLILEWKPLVLSYSESQGITRQLKSLTQGTEVVITQLLVENGFYLKGNNSSTKLMSALALSIPVVTIKFLESVISVIKSDQQLLQKDFYGNFPKSNPYLVDPRYDADPRRRTLFQGIAFIFCEKSKYDALSASIIDAGGKSYYFDLMKDHGNEKLAVEDLYQYVKKISNAKSYNNISLIKYSYNVSQSIAEINNLSIMSSAAKQLGYKLTDPMLIFESIRDINCSGITNNQIDKSVIATPLHANSTETPSVLTKTAISSTTLDDDFTTPILVKPAKGSGKNSSLCTPETGNPINEDEVRTSIEGPKGGIGARRRARAETAKSMNIMSFLVKREGKSNIPEKAYVRDGNNDEEEDSYNNKIMSSFPSPPPFGSSAAPIRGIHESEGLTSVSAETPDSIPIMEPVSSGKLGRRSRVTKIMENPLLSTPVSNTPPAEVGYRVAEIETKRRKLTSEAVRAKNNGVYIKPEFPDDIEDDELQLIRQPVVAPTFIQQSSSEPLRSTSSLPSPIETPTPAMQQSESNTKEDKITIQSKIRSNKNLQSEKFAHDWGGYGAEGELKDEDYEAIMDNLSLEEEFDVDSTIAKKLRSNQLNGNDQDGVLRVYGIAGDNGWNEKWNGRKNFKMFKKVRSEKNSLILDNGGYGGDSASREVDFDFDIEDDHEDESSKYQQRQRQLLLDDDSSLTLSNTANSMFETIHDQESYPPPKKMRAIEASADEIISDSSDNDPLFVSSGNLSDNTFFSEDDNFREQTERPSKKQVGKHVRRLQPPSKRQPTLVSEPSKPLSKLVQSTPKRQWTNRAKSGGPDDRDSEDERRKFNFGF